MENFVSHPETQEASLGQIRIKLRDDSFQTHRESEWGDYNVVKIVWEFTHFHAH
ncbi:MAG: hypothetical protein HOH33_14230 [Verrucomicrobia bacterium]|jgi:hypothetical protein|nr:hypothetical protein [Verrucomicrobiota bacterium]